MPAMTAEEKTAGPDEIAAVLRAAKLLICERRHWTQHAYARSATGECVTATDPRAVQWCAKGAITHVAAAPELRAAAIAALNNACGPGQNIVLVNDHRRFMSGFRNHQAVHAAFRRAIRTAEQPLEKVIPSTE